MKQLLNSLQEKLPCIGLPRINVRHFSRIHAGYLTSSSSPFKPHPEIIQKTYNRDVLYENTRCSATHKVPTKAIMDKYKLSNITRKL